MRSSRIWIVLVLTLFSVGVGYAVFAPVLGTRQNAAEAEFQKAWLLYQDRKFDAANEKFSEALNINPDFHWARRFLANSRYFSGEQSEALEEFETLARALPHDLTLKNRIDFLQSVPTADDTATNEFYRIVPHTQGYRYNRPTFVGMLQSDRFAVLSLGRFDIGNMVSYSAQGEPLENRHRVSGKLDYPMAFAQNDEQVWITDFKQDKIHRLDKKSKRWFSYFFNTGPIGKNGEGELEFRAPAGVCHRNGEFIVADSGNNRLQRISDGGAYLQTITRPVGGDAMQTPFGVHCDEDSIWLTESGAARITHFDRYGNIVAEFTPPEIKRPRHITWDETEQLFLVADETAGIVYLDKSGNVVRKLAGYTNTDGRFISFARPYAAAFDAFRNFYVADYGASEVVQFVPPNEKFGQLYLQVEKISAAKFPQIGVYVTAAAPGTAGESGLPKYLTELTAQDFKILENDAPVGNLGIEYLKQFDDVLQVVILMPRSAALKEYETQLPWVMDHVFTRIREKDRFRVMSCGSDVRRESDFSASRLNLLRAMRQSLADATLAADLMPGTSMALYDGITELLSREGKRALLYVTDGTFDDDALAPYSKERIIDYARANHIPIHIVSFEGVSSATGRDALKEIALKTGGSYVRALDIDDQFEARLRLRKEVRYVLSYQSQVKKEIRGQYTDMRVLARFRNMRGLDLSGYFIP
ncbi:MAG: hypothetical protein JSR44_15815 [Spirochaetes bacterium]|nr:hypothetical protein [Spirochaetota bacterium]